MAEYNAPGAVEPGAVVAAGDLSPMPNLLAVSPADPVAGGQMAMAHSIDAEKQGPSGNSQVPAEAGKGPPLHEVIAWPSERQPSGNSRAPAEQPGVWWHEAIAWLILLALAFPKGTDSTKILDIVIYLVFLFGLIACGALGKWIDWKYNPEHKVMRFKWPQDGKCLLAVCCWPFIFASITALFIEDIADAVYEFLAVLLLGCTCLFWLSISLVLCGCCAYGRSPTYREVFECKLDEKFEMRQEGKLNFVKRNFCMLMDGYTKGVCRMGCCRPSFARTFGYALLVNLQFDLLFSIASIMWMLFRTGMSAILYMFDFAYFAKQIMETLHMKRLIANLDYPAWRPTMPSMCPFFFYIYLPKVGITFPGLELPDLDLPDIPKIDLPDLPKVRLPDMPRILPDVTLPNIRLPRIPIPPLPYPDFTSTLVIFSTIFEMCCDLVADIIQGLMIFGSAYVLADKATARKAREAERVPSGPV